LNFPSIVKPGGFTLPTAQLPHFAFPFAFIFCLRERGQHFENGVEDCVCDG
jgi:hypothetical protein